MYRQYLLQGYELNYHVAMDWSEQQLLPLLGRGM